MVSPGRGSGKAKAARGDGESCPCGGRCPPVWQVRIFLYDQTGEEQYRTWIERNAEWLKNSPQSENGVFGCVEDSSRNISGSVMFAVYPFYMEYETRYHNKAEYAQIVRQLLTLAPSEQTDMEQTGWYLMTVIDVIDSMSREIFEHYKSLEEIFKKTIRNILAAGWNNDFSKKKVQ